MGSSKQSSLDMRTSLTKLQSCSGDHFYRSVTRAAEQSRRHFLGPMNPFFNPLQLVQDRLVETLCENAYELACGRLFISMTRVSDRQNILVSDFSSNEELIQALLCSCFIPVYCGLFCPTFRGVIFHLAVSRLLTDRESSYDAVVIGKNLYLLCCSASP
ncbi:patatin-like phospholipase domain-containing protein 2 [Hemitrygon akajei]|uniref:patatin-like phospholipase domain-containing protein 2 n=1 Tax=Hemitrygon akajei TaxID=2704970 RepID=UPI003BF97C92